MTKKEKKICPKCGSEFIQVEVVTRQSGNPKFPITVTKYKCTNEACQAETDRLIAETLRIKLEREAKYPKKVATKA